MSESNIPEVDQKHVDEIRDMIADAVTSFCFEQCTAQTLSAVVQTILSTLSQVELNDHIVIPAADQPAGKINVDVGIQLAEGMTFYYIPVSLTTERFDEEV